MLEITKYEAMAMLCLQDEERGILEKRLQALTEGFSALNQIDTEGITPLVSVIDSYNILREDVENKIISRDNLLENAPEKYDGYFQVPETL